MTLETNQFADFGSVNNYALHEGQDPKDPEIVARYGVELAQRRLEVAAQIGINPEDLRLRTISQPIVSDSDQN